MTTSRSATSLSRSGFHDDISSATIARSLSRTSGRTGVEDLDHGRDTGHGAKVDAQGVPRNLQPGVREHDHVAVAWPSRAVDQAGMEDSAWSHSASAFSVAWWTLALRGGARARSRIVPPVSRSTASTTVSCGETVSTREGYERLPPSACRCHTSPSVRAVADGLFAMSSASDEPSPLRDRDGSRVRSHRAAPRRLPRARPDR